MVAATVVCFRVEIGGAVVTVSVDESEGGLPQRDAVAAAVRGSRDKLVAAIAGDLPPEGAPVPLQSSAQSETAAGADEWELLVLGGGMSRNSPPSEDSHSEPEEPVERDTGVGATTGIAPSRAVATAAADWARRLAAARALGKSMVPHLEGGTNPPAPKPHPPPLRNRCWAVLRGRRPSDKGIYSKWTPGAADAIAGATAPVVRGFPSLAEARAFMEGAGCPAADLRR